jgi:hypothetical protein
MNSTIFSHFEITPTFSGCGAAQIIDPVKDDQRDTVFNFRVSCLISRSWHLKALFQITEC